MEIRYLEHKKLYLCPRKMNHRDQQILQIALPSIISNITVPLLGMIDVAIVGHMGSAVYIGAVAVGSMIFNLTYWLFGFLRMGTSGATSQALWRRDLVEVARLLARSIIISSTIAIGLIALQVPLKWLVFWLISPTADVTPYASTYFNIVIWGAPATLGLYSMTGWFIGMQNTRIPMLISIMQNIVNILASIILVYGFKMKIEGVALGTLIAQYSGAFIALILLRNYKRLFKSEHLWSDIFPRNQMLRFFQINRDIFLRTLCLVAVNLFFTSASARNGAVILSVNTMMMQFYLFFSYFMDGFAYAGEALCGRLYGACNRNGFVETLHRLFLWMIIVTVVFCMIFFIAGMPIVQILTNETEVIKNIRTFLFWTWLFPIAGSLAFIWDGIFIGITATRGMLVSSFISSLLFLLIFIIFSPTIGNHALWLAQILYLLSRGVIQSVWYKKYITPSLPTL